MALICSLIQTANSPSPISLAASAMIARIASTGSVFNSYPLMARNEPTAMNVARLLPSANGWLFAKRRHSVYSSPVAQTAFGDCFY